MIVDVSAAEVRVGDVLSDGVRVERRRESPDGEWIRLAVRKPSWRCRKLLMLPVDAPVRVLRAPSSLAS